MPCKFRVVEQKQHMVKGAIRNIFDGSNLASVKHFVNEMETDDHALDANDLDSYLANMPLGSTLMVINDTNYFIGMCDLLIVKKIANNSTGFNILATLLQPSSGTQKTKSFHVDFNDFSVENIVSETYGEVVEQNWDGYQYSILLYGVDGNRLIPEFDPLSRNYNGDWVMYPTHNSVKENETKSETKQEEKTMTKISSVIDKNKAALIQAGKIEAGSIVMKRISKLVTPQLPFMVRAYADTPAGRLVMANIFNFAVTQYAGNNKNAVLLADAALQGSMVEMLQSFNFNDLIDKVIEGVDTSKLVSSDNE